MNTNTWLTSFLSNQVQYSCVLRRMASRVGWLSESSPFFPAGLSEPGAFAYGYRVWLYNASITAQEHANKKGNVYDISVNIYVYVRMSMHMYFIYIYIYIKTKKVYIHIYILCMMYTQICIYI